MKTLTLLTLTLLACVLMGCGGMPKPKIEAMTPRQGATNVRMVLTATNYDESWVNEKVHVRCKQIWLNEDGVPITPKDVFDKVFDGRQGDVRAQIEMRDGEGQQTDDILLKFEVVSGENPTQENMSVSTTVEWSVPSGLRNKDLLMVCVLSRKSRNSYAVDVLYALEPATGEMVQILPSYNAK